MHDPALAGRIRMWHDQLVRYGGFAQTSDDAYENAVKLAIVRWAKGLGADETDRYGTRAFAAVIEVLGEQTPASGQFPQRGTP